MDMQSMIDQNMADIAADVENFVAYTAGGALHTILPREEFYTYAVDGVRSVERMDKKKHTAALAALEQVLAR